MSGESLHVVPHPDDPKASWYSIADLATPAAVPQAQRVRSLVSALVVAYREGDKPGVQTAASALGSRLGELAPGVYPARKDLALEVHYNRAKPFRTAWLLYLLAFLALIASFPLASRTLSRAGMALVVVGLPLPRLRDDPAGAHLRPAPGHQHVRVGRLGGLRRDALRSHLRSGLQGAHLRRLRLRPRGHLPDPGRQRADPRRLDFPARAGAARQHVADRARSHDHPRVRGLHARHGHRPSEPRALLLPPGRGGALQDALALPVPRAAGGDALPGGGDAPRRRLGFLLVGPLLGLGPEGDLGPHRHPRIPRDPARPLRRAGSRTSGWRWGRSSATCSC